MRASALGRGRRAAAPEDQAGRAARSFLKRLIEERDEIDYARYVRHVGLELARGPKPAASKSTARISGATSVGARPRELPELPETETIARDLDAMVRGAVIAVATVVRPDVLRGISARAFATRVRQWHRTSAAISTSSNW